MGKTDYQIVMEQRKQIVDKIISNLEKGYFLTEDRWNREALRPQNPISNVKYNGVNRLILGLKAIEEGYTDSRWLTYKQAQENNLRIKKEELKNFTICEKWIWSKEIEVEDEENPGKKKKEIIPLSVPQVFYFRVYNGNQVENMPQLPQKEVQNKEIAEITDNFILSSKCEIKEVAQERAFYSNKEDKIILPPRNTFSSEEMFLVSLWHEMAHSTANEERLNRDIKSIFGTEKYAKEEITAELSATFLEAEFGIENIENEKEHSNYIKSWISVLKDDPKELFKASNEASKITDFLMNNYEEVVQQKQEIKRLEQEIEKAQKEQEELKEQLLEEQKTSINEEIYKQI